MADLDFYSDRVQGPEPRDREELPENTRNGLVGAIVGWINLHWFAERFPEECPDGNNVCGTTVGNLLADIRALIPGIRLPLHGDHMSDIETFDLLEYAYQHISKPTRVKDHSYHKHWELRFDRKSALSEFRERVNLILARGRANYEMDTDGRIVRIGSAPVRRLVHDLRPATGDEDLDNLIRSARELYASKDPEQRQVALEKLWDGYERLKTLRDPTDKRRGTAASIEMIEPPELRKRVNEEMNALREIGNEFQIRHFEVGKPRYLTPPVTTSSPAWAIC
ncbi:hypothetical protein [Nocardia alba]|uniref:Uncharacterized protein n=1 Tax=Nocardia alba TaxID=225051 RepID=A0A4R1FBA3_9NOCA|nr:hypothetical protein [Nocardia alba]TCJ89999.1 hypothetical protein DFR71_6292 [Nocardia alba]